MIPMNAMNAMNPGFQNPQNNYELMMNMFKMFGPQMMDYANPMNMGSNPMNSNPMNMGFNPMNSMHPMNSMNPLNPMNMMKSVNQMNTMHINNLNNPTLIASSHNSQILRGPPVNDKNDEFNPMFQPNNNNFNNYEDIKVEEHLRTKARNLNDFYNSVNFLKRNDENNEIGQKIPLINNQRNMNTEPIIQKTNSKKMESYLDESEIKLPNKSEFLNYQEYENNIIEEENNYNKNISHKNQNTFRDQSSKEINNSNFRDKNNAREQNYNSFRDNQNSYNETREQNMKNNNFREKYLYKENGIKETDEVKQQLSFHNETEEYNLNNKCGEYDQPQEECQNLENYPIREKKPSKEIPIQNNNFESKAKSTNEIAENDQISLRRRKTSDQVIANENPKRLENLPQKNAFNEELPIMNKKPENISNPPKQSNPFDEIPINSKGHRNFEEMLEEELQSSQYNNYVPTASPKPKIQKASRKKNFLKRHSRQFLSSAVTHAEAKKNKTSTNTKIEEENNNLIEEQDDTEPLSGQKKSKKFLTKGKGIGGGKGPGGFNPTSVNMQKEEKTPGLPQSKEDKKKTNNDFMQEEADDLSNKKKYEPNKYVSSSRNSSQNSHSSKKIEFNDDKEWVSNKKVKPLKNAEKEIKPYESKKLTFEDEKEEENESPEKVEFEEPEEQSNLIQKYFNKNKKKEKVLKTNIEISKEQEEQIIKKYVDEKIEALNQEIAKFKSENETVKRLKKKYEDMNKTLTKQMEDFAKKKEIEKNEFELLKQEELKKIQKEKKLMERQNKGALENKPSRKEREEMDILKKQIAKLSEENKLKDQRNKLAFERLRKQNEELTQKNQEFQEEIKHLETLRISSKSSAINNNINASNKVPPKNQKTANRVIEEKKEENVSNFQFNKNPSNEKKYANEKTQEEDEDDDEEENALKNNQDSEKESENDEDEDNFETYEDIINKNSKDKKIPLQENKSTNKKTMEKNINLNIKENIIKKPNEEAKIMKENLKKSNVNHNIVQKKELVIDDNDDNDEENEENLKNSYANITIRNLNKFFNEKDFDFDNNEFYLRYMHLKSIFINFKRMQNIIFFR